MLCQFCVWNTSIAGVKRAKMASYVRLLTMLNGIGISATTIDAAISRDKTLQEYINNQQHCQLNVYSTIQSIHSNHRDETVSFYTYHTRKYHKTKKVVDYDYCFSTLRVLQHWQVYADGPSVHPATTDWWRVIYLTVPPD